MPNSKEQNPRRICFLLFTFSLLLRLALISKGPYHLDCLTMAQRAQTTIQTGHLQYLHSHGFPFAAFLSAAFVYLGSFIKGCDAVCAVNVMSVLFSSLSVPVFYLICRKLTNSLTAICATTLFSLSPIFLNISVFGNTHAPGLFFILCGFYFLSLFRQNSQYRTFLIGTLLLGLAAATRIQDVIVLMPAILTFFLKGTAAEDRGKAIRDILVLLGGITLIALLFYVPVFKTIQSSQSWGNFFHFEIISRLSGKRIDYLLLNLTFLFKNFSLLGVFTLVLGIPLLLKANKSLLTFLLLWFLVPILLFSLLDITMPRFMLIASLPLYIIQGFFFSSLLKYHKFFRINALLVFLCLLAMNMHQAMPALIARHRNAFTPDYFRWIERHAKPNSHVILGDDGNFLRYYTSLHQLNRPRQVRRKYSPEQLFMFKQSIDRILAQGTDVYITEIGLLSHNPELQFTKFMLDNYQLVFLGRRPYEEWHRGTLEQLVFPQAIFRLQKK